MARNRNQIVGELLVVLVLTLWSGQLWWPLLCAVVLLPGLRSLWWPRSRQARRPVVPGRRQPVP